MPMAFRVFIPEKWHKCQKLGMFNKIKLLTCSLEIHVYASALSLLFLICRLQNEFNWTLQSPCEFLFSICLLLSLCSLLLLSSLLLCRILSGSLWLDRSANFCLMLLTFFFVDSLSNPLFIVTISVPKRRAEMICADYQVIMLCVPKVDSVENEEIMWKHSPKNWGIKTLLSSVR